MERERVLSIRDLEISFDTVHGKATAIRGMRFDLYRGETVAIVGESGSGKSVTMKAVMGIISNNQHIDHGSINYSWWDENGQKQTVDIAKMSERDVRSKICGRHISMVFQDSMTSLNPTVTIGNQIMEGMLEHYKLSREEAKARAIKLLEEVGKKIDEANYIIENIDATIIAQKPKMRPYIDDMRKNIADALKIDVDRVNVKATTEEGLGFTGSGEGISSQAICSLNSVSNYIYGAADMTNCRSDCGGCMGCQNK